MPMGIVSDQEFENEKSNSAIRDGLTLPSIGKVEFVDKPASDNSPGRKDGDVNVPQGLRSLIGQSAVSEGRQAANDIAKAFGISPSSVSAYSNGARSTASYNETPDVKPINQAKEAIGRRARQTLKRAISHITDEKLSEANARELSGIAKDMSIISNQMEPKTEGEGKDNRPQFIVFTPQVRNENTFEVVHVKE